MKSFAVCFLAAATVLPALAASVQYNIDFTVTAGGTAGTPYGSFTYDPVPSDPSQGFSNFIVHWGHATFDLTSSANAPALAADPETGCTSEGSNYQYGFLLITQSATGCAVGYVWSGSYFGAIGDGTQGYAQLFFILVVDFTNPLAVAQDEILADNFFPADPQIYDFATGTWSVNAVPEPGTLGMMLVGALAVAAMRASRRQ